MLLAFTLTAALLAADPPPEDPFADEYRVPSSSEVGLGAGQLRTMLLAGMMTNRGLVGRGTAEWMASAFFSVRGSLEVQAAADPSLHSARAGAGLHLFPYRRVDVGFFVEGGPAYSLGGSLVPLVNGGMSLSVGLSTLLFFQLDAQVGWANVPDRWIRPALLIGLGATL